jgi:hypothetical protein
MLTIRRAHRQRCATFVHGDGFIFDRQQYIPEDFQWSHAMNSAARSRTEGGIVRRVASAVPPCLREMKVASARISLCSASAQRLSRPRAFKLPIDEVAGGRARSRRTSRPPPPLQASAIVGVASSRGIHCGADRHPNACQNPRTLARREARRQ